MKSFIQTLFALMVAGALCTGSAPAQSTGQSNPTPSPDQTQSNPAPSPDNAQPKASEAPDQQSTSGSQGPVLVDPGRIYNDKTPTRWVNKTVTLKNVMVQDTNDDGNFWVGSDDHHRLLVVKTADPTLSALKIHKGDVVTISGTVKAAGDYAAVGDRGSIKDAQDSSGVFLRADKVDIASSTQH